MEILENGQNGESATRSATVRQQKVVHDLAPTPNRDAEAETAWVMRRKNDPAISVPQVTEQIHLTNINLRLLFLSLISVIYICGTIFIKIIERVMHVQLTSLFVGR